MQTKMYQVSTLQALALGYTRSVTTVEELISHGDTGLGTFENVDGEMIVLDGQCFRAMVTGDVVAAEPTLGVPFAAVAPLQGAESFKSFATGEIKTIAALKTLLNLQIEEWFGLNSMHVVRIDGVFEKVSARSEVGQRSHHVTLKDMLSKTQKDFFFDQVEGSLVCVYFPDYMDGINAPGWHFHFLSKDHTKGGHVFEIDMKEGTAQMAKVTEIEISLPSEPAFDTYALKEASQDDIKKVEQGGKK